MSEDKTKFDCFTKDGDYIATLPNYQQAKMYINLCTTYEGVEYKPHTRSVSVPELKLELCACPFCGGEPGLFQSSELEYLYKVSCWECGACSDWENLTSIPKLVEKWNTRPETELVAACEKPKFDRCEIFVIKACKGHFELPLTGPDFFEQAKTIIRKIVYNSPKVPDSEFLRYARALLIKTHLGRSAERWEQFTETAMSESEQQQYQWKVPFEDAYLMRHYGEISALQVMESQPDESLKTLIDLSISETEENEIKRALEGEKEK